MLIDKYRVREFFGTRHKWADLEVIIVSSQQVEYKKPPQLLLFQIQAASKRSKDVLPNAIEQAKSLKPIEVMSFRQEVSSELGSLLSNHIIELQKTYLSPKETLVEDAAKRYLDLVSWGEPNSAKVLAEAEGISIRTIHSRLMNARKKGILESPGSGFRFNTGV
jgi:hypothetical protein